MATNKETKSNRLLQSRRFTLNGLADTQEAFTQVLDLNASEIYAQEDLIPASALPFSGSSQSGATTEVLKYWYRHKLTKANDGTNTAWFFLTSYGGNDGVTPQLINNQQETNFISPKYSIASIANANTEDATPGYNIRVFVSTNSSAPAAGDVRPVTDYTYNYKYGVLNFENDPPTNSEYVYVTAYQYTGRTLADNNTQGYSGSFSGSFEGDGTGLTNIPASGIVGLNLTQIATSDTTASVSSGGTAFNLDRSETSIFSIDNTGGYSAQGDSTITGSLEISQDLVVQGTASFGRINSVTGSAKIIGDAFIILNADVPASRYAGIIVIDSGSTSQTGSLLYDAEADHWFYKSTAEGYSSGLMAGPRATQGNITWPSRYAVTRGDGGNHIVNSNIFSTASNVTINKGATGSLSGLEILGDLEVTGSFRVTGGATGSFSGSFQGDSSGIANFPVFEGTGSLTGSFAGVVDATGSFEGSINAVGVVSGSLSGSFEGNSTGTATFNSLNATGSLTGSLDGIATLDQLTVNGTSSLNGPLNVDGITFMTSSVLANSPDDEVTGKYVLISSQSAWHYSTNVGYPVGDNQWTGGLEGSYFENFNHNTDTSTVLRFLAGLLSASAPSPTPNTRTYASTTNSENSLGSTDTISVISDQRLSLGYTSSAQISQNFKDTINYGIVKGWSAVGEDGNGEGTQPWKLAGAAYYQNFSTYNFTFTSNASAGSGGNGSNFFGLSTLDPAKDFKVRLIGSMSFSDTASVTAPDASTGTITQTKTLDFSRSVATNTSLDGNGLGLATIFTENPAVIPNTFQDARFSGTGGTAFLTRSFGDTISATGTVSSSGYYRFYGMQAGMTSGSSTDYIFKTVSAVSRLWLPVAAIEASMSATPASITAAGTEVLSSSIAPSRSLSGAPYLTAGTSTWTYSTTASGIFNPAYRATTVFSQTVTDSVIGSVTISSGNLVLDANGIVTDGKVYDASGNVKDSGLPRIDDEVRSTATITHSISSTDENIGQGTGLTVDFALATDAKAFNNDNADLDNRTIPYHQPGTFGQPVSSGSLGIYGRAQGYDPGSLTGGTETFFGEDFRPKIDNDLLSGSYQDSNLFTSATPEYYNLSGIDLQVKPGYLVRPGSTNYGYWLADPDNTKDYKFYARAFRVSTTYTTLFVDIGKTLNNWTSTSDGASVAILFKSVFDNGNLPVTFGNSNPVLFDISATTSTTIATNVVNNDSTNPFTDNINIYGNNGGTKSSTKYGMSLISGLNQILNTSTTYVDFIVLVRYKGDVAPVTTITQSNS